MANKTRDILVSTRIDVTTTGLGCTGTQTIQMARLVKSGKHGKLLVATARELAHATGEIVSQLGRISRSGAFPRLSEQPTVRVAGWCYADCSLHQLALCLSEDKDLPEEADCIYHGIATGNC